MTVRELLDALEGLDEGAEVRLACQPSWPFEYRLQAVASAQDLWRENDEATDPEDRDYSGSAGYPKTDVVYLFEGYQLGYLPGYAREGWR